MRDQVESNVRDLLKLEMRTSQDGRRRQDLAIQDVQEMVLELLLAKPNLIFDIAKLGADSLDALVLDLQATLDDLSTAVDEAQRQVVPVTSLDNLDDADRSLRMLQGSPSNSRFLGRVRTAVQEFNRQYRGNIVMGGALARSPIQARQVIDQNASTFLSAWTVIVERVALIVGLLDAFVALNLENAVALGSIDRARGKLNEIKTRLEAQDPVTRTENLYKDLLDLRVIPEFLDKLKFAGPSETISSSSPITPSTTRNAVGPALTSLAAPFSLSGSLVLDVTTSAGLVSAPIPDSQYPEVGGSTSHNFQPSSNIVGLHAGPYYPLTGINDEFIFWLFDPTSGVESYVRVVHTSPVGPITAATLAADLNNAISVAGLAAYYQALDVIGFLQITSIGVGTRKIVISGAPAWKLVGMTRTGGLDVVANSLGRIWSRKPAPYNIPVATVVRVLVTHPTSSAPIAVDVPLTAGGAQPAATVAADFQAAFDAAAPDPGLTATVFALNYVRLTAPSGGAITILQDGEPVGFYEGDATVQTVSNQTLTVTVPGSPSSPYNFLATSGFYSADDLTAYMNGLVAPAGDLLFDPIGPQDQRQVRLRYTRSAPSPFVSSMSVSGPMTGLLGWIADYAFYGKKTTARALLDQVKPLLLPSVVASRVFVAQNTYLARSKTTDANTIVLYVSRGQVQVTSPAVNTIRITGATAASIGDVVYVRDGVNAGSTWSVTSLDPLDGVGAFTPVAGQSFVEIGPNLVVSAGQVLDCTTPNLGSFTIKGQGTPVFEVLVDEQVPTTIKDGQPVLFSAQLGLEYIKLAAVDLSPSSTLALSNTASAVLFSTLSAAAGVLWWTLPKGLRPLVGDQVERYTVSTTSPSTITEIQQLDGQDMLLTAALPPTSLPFSGLPSVKIRNLRYKMYLTLRTALQAWQSVVPSTRQFQVAQNRYRTLRAPSIVESADFKNSIAPFYSALGDLRLVLAAYVIATGVDIDVLLRTLNERGAARSSDLINAADIKSFLTTPASYEQDLKESMRDILVNDLPANASGRTNAKQSEVVSQIDDYDPEYSAEDQEYVDDPDLPDQDDA